MTANPNATRDDWLEFKDIREEISNGSQVNPWFTAYRFINSDHDRSSWYSALVPPSKISQLLKHSAWDIFIGDGRPGICSLYDNGIKRDIYLPKGSLEEFEPLIIHRYFHGLHPDFIEISQEFRLYFNLFPDLKRNRILMIDDNGDEIEAARFGDDFFEIRTELVRTFCNLKQMALCVYFDGCRKSNDPSLRNKLSEESTEVVEDNFRYTLDHLDPKHFMVEEYTAVSRLIGKRFFLPGSFPTCPYAKSEAYQEFIIGHDQDGVAVRFSCDPKKLANNFGENPDSPRYHTPVFFRREVLSKYYDYPSKYIVEDGFLKCGSLWHLRIDNDNQDVVMVYLGDLGRDLSESERNYWLSFNIEPMGRKGSDTNRSRSVHALFTDPTSPDLVFKQLYSSFRTYFLKKHGFEFFLALHRGDEHFFSGLRMLSKDNQAEFDSQILSLTKLLIDSINEKAISEKLTTLSKDDKGISKLEKFFIENKIGDYANHIKFLRRLQDLRSKSAAHRKGASYDKLLIGTHIEEEGQQKAFETLLREAVDFLKFLGTRL